MTELVDLFFAALPALAFLVTPFLASTVAALVCAAVHYGLKRQPDLGEPAGEWLTALVAASGPGVKVGVSPEITGSIDGYWPESRFVGLSPRTWVDRGPAGRAVASHELGHALAWARDTRRASTLAMGRRVQQHALPIAGAGMLTAALMDSGIAASVAFVALLVGLVGHVCTLLDEGDASLRAAAELEKRGLRSRGTDLAMLSAFGVYLAPALVHLGFLLGAPWLLDALFAPSVLLPSNSAPGLWAVLLLAPILALRAAQVLAESHTPPPITNEFRLNWTLFQERSWEFHSAVIVLLWLVLTYDEPVSRGLAPLFVLGAIPAMGTLGAIGRMLVVLPIFFVLALLGFLEEPPNVRSLRAPTPTDPLELVRTDSPWSARAIGLLRVGWLPLLVVMVCRAVSGW
ncbi:MAG: zinc metallopeptidase [Alphaproteobacteria bacterium]|nr:zinc metallopeptidase [Alphaproteobacteria bacterium]